MKNRVAAQNARDRKKAKLEESEAIINELNCKIQKLELENQRLQEENTRLRLGLESKETSPSSDLASKLPVESAAFFYGPQQQGQGRNQTHRVLVVLQLMMLLHQLGLKLMSQHKVTKKKMTLKRTLWPYSMTSSIATTSPMMFFATLRPP